MVNYLVTFSFGKCQKFGHVKLCKQNTAKIWVGWTTLNEKKKREREGGRGGEGEGEREREDALGLIKQVS